MQYQAAMLQALIDELELARGQGNAAFEAPVRDLQAMDGGASGIRRQGALDKRR